MLTELLKEIITSLESMNINYMVSGSLAMSTYATPRMTRDIDIVIELFQENIEGFLQIFEKDFYIHRPSVEEEIKRKGMFNAIDHRSGYKIDFIVRKDSPYRKLEFERRSRSKVLGFDVWLVSAEDLIISKLIWIQEIHSDKQREDIQSLLETPEIDRDYIKTWIKELNLKTFDFKLL